MYDPLPRALLTGLLQRHESGRLNQLFMEERPEIVRIARQIREDERILGRLHEVSARLVRRVILGDHVVLDMLSSLRHQLDVVRGLRQPTL